MKGIFEKLHMIINLRGQIEFAMRKPDLLLNEGNKYLLLWNNKFFSIFIHKGQNKVTSPF
jgi:hypothetical protein